MAYYDYSALSVKKNGSTVTPTAVKVIKNGSTVQIYRLKASGTDIIHKYLRTTISLTLTATMRVSSYEYTSCSSDFDEGFVESVSLRFSWSASGDKTVSSIKFSSYYVDVYNSSSGGTRLFDCSVKTETIANGTTKTLDGTYTKIQKLLSEVRAYIYVGSMTVTFTDGTTATVSIGGASRTETIPDPKDHDRTDTFTASYTKYADVKEY